MPGLPGTDAKKDMKNGGCFSTVLVAIFLVTVLIGIT